MNERIEERLPLGAIPAYDMGKGCSAFYINEDGSIGESHGTERVRVPMFLPQPGAAKRLEAHLVAAKGPFRVLRVIFGPGGTFGLCGFQW